MEQEMTMVLLGKRISKKGKTKEGPSKGIKQFTPGAKELVKELIMKIFMKVLRNLHRNPYTTQSMWGKKQVEKSIEKNRNIQQNQKITIKNKK